MAAAFISSSFCMDLQFLTSRFLFLTIHRSCKGSAKGYGSYFYFLELKTSVREIIKSQIWESLESWHNVCVVIKLRSQQNALKYTINHSQRKVFEYALWIIHNAAS